ncbi:MAG: M14 family zinc carboxypeptidase, partial [Bdellovibrio sp.]
SIQSLYAKPSQSPLGSSSPVKEAELLKTSSDRKSDSKRSLSDQCFQSLSPFPGKFDREILKKACAQVAHKESCQSVQGVPIYHFDRNGIHASQQRILVFSLIHGDETPAGSVGRLWVERLQQIEPRNTWRVIPMLNPDGVQAKTRTNANKIDLNRNFPTQDWEEKAQAYWKKTTQSNPRRFPGSKAASEPETQCALAHIEEFKPDMVVSIHTPLKVLDFDGPKVKPPKYNYLPWKTLGHYPGSLGRFMWHERKVPVLTMELKEDLPSSEQPLVQLQDIIGFLVSLDLSDRPRAPTSMETEKEEYQSRGSMDPLLNKSIPSESLAGEEARKL